MHILDVRTKEEFEVGHIEGAELFDIMDIMQGELPQVSLDTPLLLYCESGNRAMMAKTLLEQEEYTNVENGGGLEEMTAKGYKLIQ